MTTVRKGAQAYIKKNKDRLGPAPKDQKKNVLKNTPLNLPKNKSLPKKKGADNGPDLDSRNPRNSRSSSSRSSSVTKPGHDRVEKRARKLTNGIIRGEVKDLRSQRGEINRAADSANERTETFYNRGVGDLTHINTEVNEQIGRSALQNQQTFNAATIQQNAASAALQNQLGSIYGGSAGGVSDELSKLGLDPAQFMGQLSADGANAQAQGAVGGSNALANLNLSSQNASQMSGLLSGMSAGSFMSNMGQNLNTRNDSLSETATERADQLGLVREAIAEAKGSRKDVFLELLTQLESSGWGQNMKSRSSSMNSSSAGSGKSEVPNGERGSSGKAPKGKTAIALSASELRDRRKKKKAVAFDPQELKKFNRNK